MAVCTCPNCGHEFVTSRFKPPTIEEVTAYCLQRKNDVDPEQWFHHYEANGWMVGKVKMKRWKSSIITWERSPLNGNGKKANVVSQVRVKGHIDTITAKAAERRRRDDEERKRAASAPTFAELQAYRTAKNDAYQTEPPF